MGKPLALDLYCGAGGACAGLQEAGFEVVGVDTEIHPDYPGHFIKGDALHPPVDLSRFAIIWASPPCQAYSCGTVSAQRNQGKTYPDLVGATRDLIGGHPFYVMENVPGAPMRKDLILTLPMFENYTHPHKRIFELSFPCWNPCPQQTPRSIVAATGKGFQHRPVVSAAGESRQRTGCYPYRKSWPMFSKEHIKFIAEKQPEFYRKHFPSLVSAVGRGGGGGDFGPGRMAKRREELGMVGTTTLEELRAALDLPHITHGTKARQRKALNNAVPKAYAEYIGRAAMRMIQGG